MVAVVKEEVAEAVDVVEVVVVVAVVVVVVRSCTKPPSQDNSPNAMRSLSPEEDPILSLIQLEAFG